jgi:DNA-binding transcriptional ArsR family regulator
LSSSDVDLVFRALADTTRRELIEQLTDAGPQTASQLAEVVPMSRQAVTKHLNILEAAGLLTVHQQGRAKRYVVTPEPLETTVNWVAAVQARWDKRLQALHDLLVEEETPIIRVTDAHREPRLRAAIETHIAGAESFCYVCKETFTVRYAKAQETAWVSCGCGHYEVSWRE